MRAAKNMGLLHRGLVGALLVSCSISASAMESEIKLSGRKDVILSVEMRTIVLDVATDALSREGDAMIVAEETFSPFTFKKPVIKRPIEERLDSLVPQVEEEPQFVEVSDSDVLNKVANSFAKRVRGVIALGSKSYLQLEGGSLLAPGTSFPARLPQVQDRSFSITVSEITADGYVLTLGSQSVRRSINAAAAPTSRIKVNP